MKMTNGIHIQSILSQQIHLHLGFDYYLIIISQFSAQLQIFNF